MPRETEFALPAPKRLLLSWAMAALLALSFPGLVCAQTELPKLPHPATPNRVASIPLMIQKASSDTPGSMFYVEQLAEARASQAVPVLEKKYKRTRDIYDKAHIASALIRLGDSDPRYWDDLASVALKVVKSTAPSTVRFDTNGKTVPGPSPEFIAWARSKGTPLGTAVEDAMFRRPGVLMLLAMTGDARAVPILQEGLLSHSYFIENAAAHGLAQLQDSNSIPMIISACEHAPAEAASAIAESLVYFDNPDAQQAVDEYLSPAAAKAYRDAKEHGKMPFSR